MDEEEFSRRMEQMADYILNHFRAVTRRPVASQVSPGFLLQRLPETPPEEGEPFESILLDFEERILPGMIHWQHPRYHGYYPASSSFPSILADIVSEFVGVSGLEWNMSRAAAELESIVTDWYGEMMCLPDKFLRNAQGSRGGGIIQITNSSCVFLAMNIARDEFLVKLRKFEGEGEAARIEKLSRLTAYCSEETNSCVQLAARMLMVNIRVLSVDEEYRLRGETLSKAIQEDVWNGMVPFFVCSTFGTTSCCACDAMDEIGQVCSEYGMWMHVDAAYAGSALICPEYRDLMKGIEHAQSYTVDASKWALVGKDCAVLYTTDRSKLDAKIAVDRTRLRFDRGVDDVRQPGTRRSLAFNLWFVLSAYGVEGLRLHIRNHACLAELFASKVEADKRFELVQCRFGLVCFRLQGPEEKSRLLLKKLNDSCKVFMHATVLGERFVIRFCVCYHAACQSDIRFAWNLIAETATEVLNKGLESSSSEMLPPISGPPTDSSSFP